MTPAEEVTHQIDRLRRAAGALHVHFPASSTATREEVEQFARETGAGDDLVAFWLAGEGLVLMVGPAGPRRFDMTPFASAKWAWLGYEREVTMHFGPQKGQTVNVRVEGTAAKGVIPLATDGSGDDLDLLLRDGPRGRAGQVIWHDHETGADTVVAQSLVELLRASNDLVERDTTRAFFYGNDTTKIFAFPGTAELIRQLDAGLSPDARYSTGNLVGEALLKRRDDLFHVLIERGADKDDALVQVCGQLRLDLAEELLTRGADPAARMSDGRTLLAASALAGRPRTVALLMRFGAAARLPPGELERLVAEVRDSYKLADRKKRDVLQALGANPG